MFIATEFLCVGMTERPSKGSKEKQTEEKLFIIKSVSHHQVQQAWEWSATTDPSSRQGLK